MMYVGERCNMVTWAAVVSIAGTRVTAVAPLPREAGTFPADEGGLHRTVAPVCPDCFALLREPSHDSGQILPYSELSLGAIRVLCPALARPRCEPRSRPRRSGEREGTHAGRRRQPFTGCIARRMRTDERSTRSDVST